MTSINHSGNRVCLFTTMMCQTACRMLLGLGKQDLDFTWAWITEISMTWVTKFNLGLITKICKVEMKDMGLQTIVLLPKLFVQSSCIVAVYNISKLSMNFLCIRGFSEEFWISYFVCMHGVERNFIAANTL